MYLLTCSVFEWRIQGLCIDYHKISLIWLNGNDYIYWFYMPLKIIVKNIIYKLQVGVSLNTNC